jgi:hypothetical protein
MPQALQASIQNLHIEPPDVEDEDPLAALGAWLQGKVTEKDTWDWWQKAPVVTKGSQKALLKASKRWKQVLERSISGAYPSEIGESKRSTTRIGVH